MTVYIDTSFNKRKCHFCNAVIPKRTVHLVELRQQGRWNQRKNRCRECSLQFIENNSNTYAKLERCIRENVENYRLLPPLNMVTL